MKYMLLLTRGAWQDSWSEEERGKVFARIGEWWGELAAQGKMVAGHRLQPPETATTVVIENGRASLVDRPLMEAKEAIGGFGILEAADLDEVLAIVRTLPTPEGKVEVRPVLER